MKILLKIIIIALLLALVLSASAGLIPPSVSIIIALAGLAFPIIWMISTFGLILIMILRMRVLTIITALLLLVTLPVMARYFSIDLRREVKSGSYKLFDFNTFGLRIPSSESNQLDCQDSLNNYLNTNKYTIVCLQEYPMKGARHAKFYEKLKNDLQVKYKCLSKYDPEEKSTQYILVTASEFPVISEKTIDYNGQSFALYTDIQFPEKIIRVYNVHLMSIKLTSEKRILVYTKKESFKDRIVQMKLAFRKLSIAFIHREKQTDLLCKSIEKSPYPVIIAGDFNDTPASYTYHRLHKKLKDASFMNINGMKRTYKQSTYPLQIDYILHDAGISTSGYKRFDLTISDHNAISTDFITPK